MGEKEAPASSEEFGEPRFEVMIGRQVNIVDSRGNRPFIKAANEGCAQYLVDLLNHKTKDDKIKFTRDRLHPDSHRVSCSRYVLGEPNKFSPYGFVSLDGESAVELALARLDSVTAPTLNTEHGAFTRHCPALAPSPAIAPA